MASIVRTRSASIPASFAPGSARSRNGDTVISIVAPESDSWWASSCAVYMEFALVTMPFARRMPWNSAAHSGRFGANSATTSPSETPRSASAAAIFST